MPLGSAVAINQIKKTMGHHTLKGVVCCMPLFLELQNSQNFDSSQKPKFLKCSEINRQSYPLTKVSCLISDIRNFRIPRRLLWFCMKF